MMHLQSCCFTNLNLLLCRSRCRRRRRRRRRRPCLKSLEVAIQKLWRAEIFRMIVPMHGDRMGLGRKQRKSFGCPRTENFCLTVF